MSYTALTFPDEPLPELLERGMYGARFRQNTRPVWKLKLYFIYLYSSLLPIYAIILLSMSVYVMSALHRCDFGLGHHGLVHVMVQQSRLKNL
jgi:hypothetical protein